MRRAKRSVPKGRAFLLCLALFPVLPVLTSEGAPSCKTGPRESRYEIFSHGLRVGDLSTVFDFVTHNDRKALRFESVTHVKADLLLFSVSLDSREEAMVAEEGTFLYRRTDRNKKGVTRVEGRLENGRFLLDVAENGARRTLAIDRSRYDHTSMECPEIAMKREGDEMAVRLLDFETLSVVTRRYRWVRSEEVVVDGKPVRCRVIDFEDPHKKGRRWIRPDDMGVVIARQEGKGKDGSYSLRMTQLDVRR